MASPGKSNVQGWPNWKIALAVGIGTPVAIGAVYWYMKKRRNSKPDKPVSVVSPTIINHDSTASAGGINRVPKTSENGKLSDDPYDKAKAFKTQGNVFYKEGTFDKAIECYTKAIEICPPDKTSDLSTFYQNRAAAYEVLKKYSQVILDCTKSLELNRNYLKALQRRAKAYETTQNLEKCLEDMTMLCIMESFQNENSIMMTDRVLKGLSKAKAKDLFKARKPCLPSKHYIRHYFISFSEDPIMKYAELYKREGIDVDVSKLSGFRLVIHQFANEQYDNIISNCNIEIDQRGRDVPEALLVRGTFKLLQGQLDEAQADLLQLLNMESVDVKVLVNGMIKMGTIKVQLEQMEEALTYFNKAVDVDLNNCDIYLHRGQVSLLMEQIDEALKDMTKSTSLNPNFPCAEAQKCYVQYRCGLQFKDENQKSSALKGFDEVLKKFPNCSESCYLYAQVLTECGEYDKAEKYFLKAGELDPQDPNVFVHRGLLAFQWKQDLDSCIELLNKAVSMDDKCHFGLETLGSLEVQRGNIARGMELFQRAIDTANTETELAHLLSLLLAAQSQTSAAEKLGVTLPGFDSLMS